MKLELKFSLPVPYLEVLSILRNNPYESVEEKSVGVFILTLSEDADLFKWTDELFKNTDQMIEVTTLK